MLLVEDDPNDVDLTLSALAERRLADGIVVARDGEEAPDCLLRRGACESRVVDPSVVLTSSREERDVVRSYELGVIAYVAEAGRLP